MQFVPTGIAFPLYCGVGLVGGTVADWVQVGAGGHGHTAMLLIGLAQRALLEGMGPVPVLRLIPFVLPDALRFAIPGTILFAACSLYGRMAADNEILAIKAIYLG